MDDDGKLILWGTLVVLLLIMIGIINPFLLILIYPSLFIYNHSCLFSKSESDLRIRLLQNDSRIYFHFHS